MRVLTHLYAVCMASPLAFAVGQAFAGGAKDAHGEASAGLPQFDPSTFPTQIFWLLVMFGVMYLFFARKTLPEISNVIEKRTEHIQNDLTSAENLRKEAEETQAAYEKKLDEARSKASKYYADAEKQIKENMEKELEAFQKRSSSEIARVEKDLEKSKDKVMADMDTLAAEIARDVAEKIIGVSTDLDQAKTVIQSMNKESKKKAA